MKLSKEQYLKWKQQRKLTIIAFLIFNLIGGMDISIILSTLLPYLKKNINTKNPEMYFAFISAAFSLSSALFGAISSRYVDRTRRMKLYVSITLILQLIGNLLYVVPFSPLYPLFGRVIAGAGEAFTSVCIGEVIRICDDVKGNQVICWLGTTLSLGYVFGPIITAPFQHVDIWIGAIHIDKYNIAGVVLAGMASFALVLCQFLVYDCSRVFDLKMYMQTVGIKKESSIDTCFQSNNANSKVFQPLKEPQNDDYIFMPTVELSNSCSQNSNNQYEDAKHTNAIDVNDQSDSLYIREELYNKNDCFQKNVEEEEEEESDEKELFNDDEYIEKESLLKQYQHQNQQQHQHNVGLTIPIKTFLKVTICNFDLCLISISSFMFMYNITTCEILLPLINYSIMNWSLNRFFIIISVFGVLSVVVSTIFGKLCTTNLNMYIAGLVCIVAMGICFVLLPVIIAVDRDNKRDSVLIGMFVLGYAFTWFVELVVMRAMLGKMVPSNVQGFAESLRNGISRFGMIAASLTTPLAIHSLTTLSSVLLTTTVLLFIVFLYRRKTLIHLKIVKDL